MEILYLLVPLSIVLVFLIGAVLWLALANGQFDDLETPGLRILADDDSPRPEEGAFDVDQKSASGGRYDGQPEGSGAGTHA